MKFSAEVHRQLTEASAAGCRYAQAHNLTGRFSAGVLKRLANQFASKGHIAYRDRRGYLVRADLGDSIERAGFFGAHSPRLLRIVTDVLSTGDWAIDVGANVGLVSAEMCSAVGRSGLVWAVEPLPRNIERLNGLKAANPLSHLTVLPGALSSKRATALLRIPVAAGGSAFGSFVADWESFTVEVPTWRLDDLVAKHDGPQPLRLIKIDAEGAEPDVIAGAEQTLRDRRPLVLCEFNDILLKLAGTSSEGLLQRFSELGYRPRTPLARPRRPLEGRCIDMLLAPVR